MHSEKIEIVIASILITKFYGFRPVSWGFWFVGSHQSQETEKGNSLK